jgi:DNA-binding MarR family transcriptional regulator
VTGTQLDEVLRPASVTPLQYTALTVLERRADLSTAELARNAFVTDQSAADMIGVLAARGLVSRVPDPADRRRRVLRLTAAGQDLLLRRFVATCRSSLASAPPH